MFRRLLLIALDYTRPKDPPLSLGHASILANLLQHKLDVKEYSWAVNKPTFQPEQVVTQIMENAHPDLDVALGGFVWNEHAIQRITQSLHRYKFPGRVILGGPQVSYLKQGLEKVYPHVDAFVRGYGENAMVKLMQNYNPMTIIKGVHFAGMPDLGLTATVPLNELPSPYLEKVLPAQPFIRWETQRGCPFKCSFCQHREPDKALMKRRNFPKARVQAEANWILNNPIIEDIAVLDPTFNSGPDYLNVLHGLIGYTGKLALQCRMEMVTPEFLDAVELINQTGNIVLEFGLQTIHKEEQRLIQRPNNMNRIAWTLAETEKRNIKTELSLIFGLPGQTLASFRQSVQYCIDMNVKTIHAFPLMILRGTLLYDKKQELGLIESHEIASPAIPRQQEYIPHVVESRSFSHDDWKAMAEIAEWLETNYNLQ
jgi:radical SAM superfamily enzyme YgiQ (UPF0313 family)